MRLLDHPRPVLTIPRWRGAFLRLGDTYPRLALAITPAVLASGRLQQRRFKRKVTAGLWPPGSARR
jgi:hypothetical protein